MPSTLEIKSTRLDALAIQLKTNNIQEIKHDLVTRFAKISDIGNTPLILDIQEITLPLELDLKSLLLFFRKQKMNVIGVKHNRKELAPWIQAHGLVFIPVTNKKTEQPQTVAVKQPEPIEKQPEKISGSQPKKLLPAILPTKIITTPVRTGQQIYAKNADLIVMAMVNQGAEVIADGNIHIYAPLRGRALAGISGNKEARIFTQSMQAELVSIAGVYRTIEQGLPPEIANKPAQIHLEQNRLVISALNTK